MKVGLYSITYLGVWYDDPALTAKEFLLKAKELGFDGIEWDGKRPHANPMDLDQAARDEIREECERLGLDIPAVSSNNDFSSPVPEHRECQLLMVREQARMTADLGAKVLRLFAAWPGVTTRDGVGQYEEARLGWARAFPDVSRLTRWRLIVECLKEAAGFGEEFGVVMALQMCLSSRTRVTSGCAMRARSSEPKACRYTPTLAVSSIGTAMVRCR
jgi:sugar phosphate isomerase/epimerase